eukprot:Gregarina_sp_Poly_1__6833@NODE_36_length_18572_cov_139_626047_g31_i0_p10_GENE_NODE_36_length_18572_cov_139_626047_g31_i0NODE_36_length_18572_cov_139_626047_g31_i0_p10_ORF_typecomplete_len120_score12_04YTH/PF04146_15/0_15_NODE_36_length_18572_cov_139_626047_g31_i090289387
MTTQRMIKFGATANQSRAYCAMNRMIIVGCNKNRFTTSSKWNGKKKLIAWMVNHSVSQQNAAAASHSIKRICSVHLLIAKFGARLLESQNLNASPPATNVCGICNRPVIYCKHFRLVMS